MHVRILLALLLMGALAMGVGDSRCLPEKPRMRRYADGGRLRRRGKALHQRKKDMYVSRGWGPGGMPFSVLYLNPTHATADKVLMPVAARQQQHPPKAGGPLAPQLRAAMRNVPASADKHPVVPQLFVSYNWAPMG